MYSLLALCHDGSETYVHLELVIKDVPVTLTGCALKHDLLGRHKWKTLKAIACRLYEEKVTLATFPMIFLPQNRQNAQYFKLVSRSLGI
jgi:hypothetical protein